MAGNAIVVWNWLADSLFQRAQTIFNVIDFFRIQRHGHPHGNEESLRLSKQLTVAGHIRSVGHDFHLRRAEQFFKPVNHVFLVCHLLLLKFPSAGII